MKALERELSSVETDIDDAVRGSPAWREKEDVLRRDMTDLKVNSRAAWTIYTAVRAFGERTWKENAQLKASGENRILKSVPTDPSITWADWKAKAGVFAP